jgi:hypothetical protein
METEKNYHICFYPDRNIELTIGVNIEAVTIEGALSKFKELHPNVEVVYIQNKSV